MGKAARGGIGLNTARFGLFDADLDVLTIGFGSRNYVQSADGD
jgi:hypothetical protein